MGKKKETYEIRDESGNRMKLELGKALYVADAKAVRVRRFLPDCVKLSGNGMSVHGLLEMGSNGFHIPKEYSLKYLDRRILFTKRKTAEEWLGNRKGKGKGKGKGCPAT